ncbi:penicillin acylase family protein [Pseudomonas akapageensis]|uniref:penicillin acylase family protein n=1 Tax=Pseudomonas akapageensis TaxID=2609961 RepID=UPI00140CD7D9|nr:penicillin acylase family protein [Pseudomonas akapageensis]
MIYLKRLVIFLLAALLLLAGTCAVYAWRSLPQTAGEVSVNGLSAAVDVVRDADGVAHLFAKTSADAYFALGYVHAQDRMWQMEMNRRMASGTLAEVFGAKVLPSDRLFRTLGLHAIAERNLAALDAGTRATLEAYSKGVNAYLAEHPVLAPEFVIASFRPGPWQPADSLAFFRLMAWRMAGNVWDELATAQLSQQFSPEQVAELIPSYPGDQRPALPDLKQLYAGAGSPWAGLLAAFPERQPVGIGSNSWALAGSRTDSGKPLLANDPHLMLSAPTLWYLAQLHAPGLDVIGATLPGMPGVILGRNQNVAWSFTNTHSDVADLYLEKQLPGDTSRYLTPEGSAAFGVREERIRVKDGDDVLQRVRSTRHGPVISDVLERAGTLAGEGSVMALDWVGLRDDDLSLQFPLKAALAADGAGLLAATRDFHSPQQNIVYADNAGSIGFIAAGRVPQRQAGNDLMGRAPSPGWDARYDWQGFIPFDALPQQLDPANGELVTANQKITPPGYDRWITSNWVLPYRSGRIHDLLAEAGVHSREDMQRMQMDASNPVARQLLPLMLQVPTQDPRAAEAVQRLARWDGAMLRARAEPLIYAEWLRLFTERLYAKRLGELYEQIGEHNPAFIANVLADRAGASRWCAEALDESDGAGACRRLLSESLVQALDNLSQKYGSSMDSWHWGDAHKALSRHAVFGNVPLLSHLFNLSIANDGGRDTVNYAGYYYDQASGLYLDDVGPGLRAVYDLDDPQASGFILSSGQSGNPFSSHYGDMLEGWANGRLVPMISERQRLEKQAHRTLVLAPSP